MPSRQDDEVSWGHASRPGGRSLLLTGGLALAVAATAASFLTDDPRYLRLAVVASAWAFVAAAFAATRRRGEQLAASAREAEVRRAYERELDLEAAGRREYELELENDLRRETEEVVRAEMAALRADVAALDRVREQIARVTDLAGDLSAVPALRSDVAALAALRSEVASLSALRSDVASLSAMRGDVAALGALREELGSLAELRTEVGRLRTELTEQLNGELLIERIIMRTQGFRRTGEHAAAADTTTTGGLGTGAALWDDEPARGLTAPPTAFRFDDPGPTREYETVRPVRSTAVAPSEPRTATFSWSSPPDAVAEPAPAPLEWLADRSLVHPDDLGDPGPDRPSRYSAAEPSLAGFPAPPPAAPLTDDLAAQARPVPYRRRRTDDEDEPRTDPAEALTTERPVFTQPPVPDPGPRTRPGTSGEGFVRVSDLVAETGGPPPSGGRRHRRYRDEDEPDDVLARVLGQQ
jgi:hypothetical protein